MKHGLYAIIDHKTQENTAPVLYLHKHEAVATRFFDDVAREPNSQIARHPDDFALVRLGYLEENLTLTPDHAIILEGRAWAAMMLGEKR